MKRAKVRSRTFVCGLGAMILSFVTLDAAFGESQAVSLIGLKSIAVNSRVNLTISRPLSEEELRQKPVIEEACNQNIRELLAKAGFNVVEQANSSQARLDFVMEFRRAPDSEKVMMAFRVDCVQWVMLGRAPQQRFQTSTWSRKSHTPFLEMPFSPEDGLPLAEGTVGRFIDDWKTVNSVATVSQLALPPTTPQSNAHQQQQATSDYRVSLAEYQEALGKLNNMQSLADLNNSLQAVAPPPTDKFGRIMSALSPPVNNFNIRAAQADVEVARQNLEVAKQRLRSLGLNPLNINIR